MYRKQEQESGALQMFKPDDTLAEMQRFLVGHGENIILNQSLTCGAATNLYFPSSLSGANEEICFVIVPSSKDRVGIGLILECPSIAIGGVKVARLDRDLSNVRDQISAMEFVARGINAQVWFLHRGNILPVLQPVVDSEFPALPEIVLKPDCFQVGLSAG